MAGYRSLEQSLTDFATIIVPLGQELGGPTASATAHALADPITSLFGVIVLNIIGFTFLRFFLQTSLHALRCGVAYLSFVTRLTPRHAYRSHRHVARYPIEAKRCAGYHARSPRASETSSGFELWEDFSKRCTTGDVKGNSTSHIDHTFTVLEVSHLATEPDIRSAYMRLMTMYHPDILTQQPESGIEELQNATVHVHQTYETLTERLYRTQ